MSSPSLGKFTLCLKPLSIFLRRLQKSVLLTGVKTRVVSGAFSALSSARWLCRGSRINAWIKFQVHGSPTLLKKHFLSSRQRKALWIKPLLLNYVREKAQNSPGTIRGVGTHTKPESDKTQTKAQTWAIYTKPAEGLPTCAQNNALKSVK